MSVFDTFAYPWLLPLVVLLVPPVWWNWISRHRRPAIHFPSVSRTQFGNPSWSLKARHLVPLFRSLAIVLLVICIARPRRADEMTRVQTEGVALQLVVDRSGSMRRQDFQVPGRPPITRLKAVKEVVRGFILGDGEDLEGRPGDLIGLTVFARYPDTECPLTRDHEHLIRALDKVRTPSRREQQRGEDQTAIGDALLLAVERIRNIGRRLKNSDDFKIKSRAIILLTDGLQTQGAGLDPVEAAEAAKALDVKVYTIGAAPLFVEQRGLFGVQQVPVQIDEQALDKVAEMTGGKYFRAVDAGSLAAIYAEIDALERSAVDEESYYLYHELAYEWLSLGEVNLPPPLLVALVVLALEALLSSTRFRRIP